MQFLSLTANFAQDIEFAELRNVVKKKDIDLFLKWTIMELGLREKYNVF